MLNDNIKIDLHIHSCESAYKEERGLVKNSDIAHAEDLLKALEEHDISMFSITDHNRFSVPLYEHFSTLLKEPSRGYKPTLLAGVEFDVLFDASGNKAHPAAHVIVIFNAPGTTERMRIHAALERHKLTGKDESYNLVSFETVLKEIGLDTILIAHQFSGLNGNQRRRSIGKATNNALDYYTFGYIDALEFNRSTIQSILRSELRDRKLPQRMITGSDCHVWQVYPKHDASSPFPDAFYATIRALPSFKGLLMALSSPETRIGCTPYKLRPAYCTSITLCGKDIPLSPGLNAIIGENGSGKSSLLQLLCLDRVTNWARARGKVLGFSCANRPSNPIYIKQNELQDKYHSDSIFEGSLFTTPDHTQFETVMRGYAAMIKRCISQNLAKATLAKKASETSFTFDENLEGGAATLTAQIDEGVFDSGNPWSEADDRLGGIVAKISGEEERRDVYDTEELEKLDTARRLLLEVRKSVSAKGRDRSAVLAAQGAVLNALKRYKNEVESRVNDKERCRNEYQAAKSELIATVVSLAKAQCEPQTRPQAHELDISAGSARSVHNGFTFVRTAAYKDQNYYDAFIDEFNTAYRDLETICNLGSERDVLNAIPRSQKKSWENAFDTLVDGFIAKMEDCSETILDSDQNQSGNTMGEKAITYFKYQSVNINGATVFVVDQPEDNISNQRISGALIEYLNDLRKRSQIIIVTHSPLLVVNLDADNVVALKPNDKTVEVSSGCLESEDDGAILADVATILDGGKEAVERRLKAYGSLH